jgi:hypothetical protein
LAFIRGWFFAGKAGFFKLPCIRAHPWNPWLRLGQSGFESRQFRLHVVNFGNPLRGLLKKRKFEQKITKETKKRQNEEKFD